MVVVEDVNQQMYNLTDKKGVRFIVGDGEWLIHNTICIRFASPNIDTNQAYRLSKDFT